MAQTRAYIRGSGGKFAGSNAKGTRVTYGKAGGFANAAFRTRVQNSRATKSTSLGKKARALGKKSLDVTTSVAKTPLGSYLILSGAAAAVSKAGAFSSGRKVGRGVNQISHYKGANVRRSMSLASQIRTGR